MKVWKASLALYPSQDKDSENKYQTYFKVVECKEDFKFIEERKEFFYSEGWIHDRIPSVISEEYGTYDIVKIVQGFDQEPTEEEKSQVEMQMKEHMLEILEAREEEYLSNLDEQLGLLKETIKYRYEITGVTNDGKKFNVKCVDYTYLDNINEILWSKGFHIKEIQSKKLANANAEIAIEEMIVLD